MANRNTTNPIVVGFIPDDTATTGSAGLIAGFTPTGAMQGTNQFVLGWVPVDPTSQMGTNALIIGWIPIPDTIPDNIIGASLQGTGIIGAFARARKLG